MLSEHSARRLDARTNDVNEILAMRAPVRFSSVALAAVAVFAFTALYVSDRELARSPAMTTLRYGLWAMGAATLIALTLALVHERRLTRRVAERSAELERLSAELLRANRAKSEFLANVSHELRTPLNAIVGFVDLLRDGVYGELQPRQVGPVQRIEASALHLRHLVDQVLDLAKMTAGRMEVHTERLDLRPFVLEVATEVEPLANERNLALSMAIPASLPRLRTDPSHLRQVLVNLLGNAVKYTTEGGIVVRGRIMSGEDAVAPSLPPDGI
jgi:signal transduction histidine kinase